MRRAFLAFLSVLAGLLLQGCNDHYHLELTPQGESMARRLSAYRLVERKKKEPKVEAPGDKCLAALAKTYGKDGEKGPGEVRVFRAEIKDRWTNVQGGHAEFARYASDLGTVFYYTENLTGDAHLAEDLEFRMKAADLLVAVLKEWFERELKDEPKQAALAGWLDKNFRSDLKNVCVYARIADVGNKPPEGVDDAHAKLLNYLYENEYFTRQEGPRLLRALVNLESGEGEGAIFAWLQRFVARRMGVADTQPVPESLAFLGSRSKLLASANAHIYKTEAFRKAYEYVKEQAKRQNPEQFTEPMAPPNPGDGMAVILILSMMAGQSNWASFLSPEKPAWSAALALPVEPFVTNGSWDGEKKQVRWGDPNKDDKGIRFVYAGWCEPSERQTARFGKVLLDGARLGAYALWFQALHESERAEWAAFVDTVRPGGDLKKALETFRFKAEQAVDEKEIKPALSNAVRQIFSEALAPEEP